MGAEAVTVNKDPGWVLLVAFNSLGNFDLQLFLAEAGPLGAIQRHHGLAMKSIAEHHSKAVTLIIIIMDEALGLGPEDHLVIGC
jgi:hypothetical protein